MSAAERNVVGGPALVLQDGNAPRRRSLALWRDAALIGAIGLGVYLVRVLTPSDLADNHQDSPTAYVLDVIKNGHWLSPHDVHGAIASKPPLFTWLAAL